ncbi:MAG: hemerythrin [Chloroflexota bacterium]
MSTRADAIPASGDLAAMAIRDLAARFPETMPELAALGLDLCCGGGHALGEALDLHGIDRGDALARVLAAVEGRVGEG